MSSKNSALTGIALAIVNEAEQQPSLPILNGVDDDSTSEDDEQRQIEGDTSFDRRKKPRIPWDRNIRGDKNGLKYALLSLIKEHGFHVNGRYMDNFKEVSALLSQEGTIFSKYNGIEPSGAQRKFNSIIRDVAKTFKLTESGEFVDESHAEGFEILALSMLKDMIVKEKLKKLNRSKPHLESYVPGEEEEVEQDYDLSAPLLKKRKAEMTPLKNALRKAADAVQDQGKLISRLNFEHHDRVIQDLASLDSPVLTVGDFLTAADVSSIGVTTFVATTQVKLDKPVDRILKLYEEVAEEKDYVAKMKQLCGIPAADALEIESFIKPFYLQRI